MAVYCLSLLGPYNDRWFFFPTSIDLCPDCMMTICLAGTAAQAAVLCRTIRRMACSPLAAILLISYTRLQPALLCLQDKRSSHTPGGPPKLKAVESWQVLVASDTRSMTQYSTHEACVLNLQGMQTHSFAAPHLPTLQSDVLWALFALAITVQRQPVQTCLSSSDSLTWPCSLTSMLYSRILKQWE